MNAFWNKYYEISHQRKFFLATTLIFLISQITIITILHRLGTLTVLELQTTFSPDRFLEIIRQWESEGILYLYNRHFYFDHIHPLWYSLFGSSLLAITFNRGQFKSRVRIFLLAPFLAGFCDVMENQFHVWFLADLTRVTSVTLTISAFFCWMKWILLVMILGFVLFQFVTHRNKEQ